MVLLAFIDMCEGLRGFYLDGIRVSRCLFNSKAGKVVVFAMFLWCNCFWA